MNAPAQLRVTCFMFQLTFENVHIFCRVVQEENIFKKEMRLLMVQSTQNALRAGT